MTAPSPVLGRYVARWSVAVAGYEEASARYRAVIDEYLALVGTPYHGADGRRARVYSETEARILAKRDHRRQKAVCDQEFWAAEATMYGIAVLVETGRTAAATG